MTLTIVVAVFAYILLLIVIVAAHAELGHRMSVLGDEVLHLAETVAVLGAQVDAARYETQVVPDRIIKAYEKTLA